MNLTLPIKIQKLIKQRVKSGKYRRAEDVVTAAISTLDQQDSFGDFAPGELDGLLAKGEQDIKHGRVIAADRAFARLKRISATRRKKTG
jgi:Arc/MetJ-type ribon-helix-helix transcriptional regulator